MFITTGKMNEPSSSMSSLMSICSKIGLYLESFLLVNRIASILPFLDSKSHFLPIFLLGLQFLFTELLPVSVNVPPMMYAFGSIRTPLSDKSKSVLVIPISHKSSFPQNG